MATAFIPLDPTAFPDAARPSIDRLNIFLLELSRLEGTIRQPIQSRRSDATVARRDTVQVDVSRITPSITQVVSGQSTVVGVPALTLSTTNAVGITTTSVSINSTIALFGTQAPSGLSTNATVGSSAYAARADHIHEFPTTVQSAANNSTLTLTDDGTDQTFMGSLGVLNIHPGTGVDIDFPNSSSAVLNIRANTTTAATTLINPSGRPTAGSRNLMAPNWFSAANTSDVFSAQTFRCWDAQFSAWPNAQITGTTIVAYDASVISITPSAGSSGTGNCLYGIRFPTFSINSNVATWSEVITGYFKGVRRSLSSVPIINTQAAIVVEPPTAGTTDQVGIYIRQQSAQATATNRFGLKIDSQNSGTNRWSIYGVSDRAQFTGPLVCDGAFGSTGNANFGSSVTIASDLDHNGTKVGLYGATPTVQFGTTGTETGFAAGTSTTVTEDSTFTGNTGSLAYTIGDVVRALKMLGGLAY